MVTADQIRRDLKNIRYYYARREVFENSEAEIVGMAFLPIIRKYNQAIRKHLRGFAICMSVFTS